MGVAIARRVSGYRAAVRLGWAVSSNWTSPLLFIVYSVLRPVSMALILAVMYAVITRNAASARPYLAFLITGTAFWSFIQEGVSEFATGIVEDRGRYHILKYAYIAPLGFPVFLLGRATSKLASAAASVVIVLLIGALALHIDIDPLRIDYGLLAVACLLAFVSIVAFAITLSITLLAGRDTHGYGEIMAQFLYLFSGAIFPISVLPGPIAWLASLSPLPYWLELCRRAILHGQVTQMFPSLTDGEVLLRLIAATAGTVFLAVVTYRLIDKRARRMGYLDMEANW